jgi:hypothetical protein
MNLLSGLSSLIGLPKAILRKADAAYQARDVAQKLKVRQNQANKAYGLKPWKKKVTNQFGK